jgi:5-methyltetrahydropteroyltriglutamate--homocysteine methyltransferase
MWRIAQDRADKPIKFAANSCHNYAAMCDNRYYSSEAKLLMELAKINNAELKALNEAGCKHIQIDEPIIHFLALDEKLDTDRIELFKEAFNKEIEGLTAEIWAHTCWGNPNQQSSFIEKPSYEKALPHLLDLKADVLTFEAASSGGRDLAIFKEYPTKKKIAIGAVNHVNNQVETAEMVADLLVRAANYIDPSRLIAMSDCGFGREGMSRRIAFYKLKALAEGAKIAGKRLD